MTIVAPSILAADLLNLGQEIHHIEHIHIPADWIHIDIMDGHFVPNISLGVPVVKTLSTASKLLIDVHLMLKEPSKHLKIFKDSGAQQITIHLESSPDPLRDLLFIKDLGIKAGIALTPSTDISLVKPFLDYCDLVLLLTVNPGFSGQSMLPNSAHRLQELVNIRKNSIHCPLIIVDGGVTVDNASRLISLGSDGLVIGQALFGSRNYAAIIEELKA